MKNNRQTETGSQSARRTGASDRNTAILIAAIIFFLLGLALIARATGFDLFDSTGRINPHFGANKLGIGTTSLTGTAGTRGTSGASGSNGTSGTGANGSNTNGTGNTDSNKNLNIQLKSDNGTEINAGVDDQGRLYVIPNTTTSTDGGVGAQGTVNDNKVIDTHSLLK
jgi:hypothetical protein